MLVWFSDWQLSEAHFTIAVGDAANWEVYPSDQAWATRLFGDRLVIEWEYDTYGDAADRPSRRVRGEVVNMQSVRCVLVQDGDALVPVPGAAVLSPEHDTSGSWIRDDSSSSVPDPAPGSPDTGWRSYTSIYAEGDVGYLFGYVVTLAVDDA